MNPAAAADPRRDRLTRWLQDELGLNATRIEPASADASFRRYFRATAPGGSLVVMDAPPDREDLGPYLAVADVLGAIGLNVPRVLARDVANGFLLLSDLGTRQYLDELRHGLAGPWKAHQLPVGVGGDALQPDFEREAVDLAFQLCPLHGCALPLGDKLRVGHIDVDIGVGRHRDARHRVAEDGEHQRVPARHVREEVALVPAGVNVDRRVNIGQYGPQVIPLGV